MRVHRAVHDLRGGSRRVSAGFPSGGEAPTAGRHLWHILPLNWPRGSGRGQRTQGALSSEGRQGDGSGAAAGALVVWVVTKVRLQAPQSTYRCLEQRIGREGPGDNPKGGSWAFAVVAGTPAASSHLERLRRMVARRTERDGLGLCVREAS